MAADELLELLDAYWFEHTIFSSRKPFSLSPQEEGKKEDDHHHHHHHQQQNQLPVPRLPTLNVVRSLSDQNLSSPTKPKTFFSEEYSDSLSPNSVLATPNLQTGLSGDEQVRDFHFQNEDAMQDKEIIVEEEPKASERKRSRGRWMRRKGGSTISNSRSLSELEFEELKGFMDLGFVFSEEDKDSSLVSIIPGLQRLHLGKDQAEKSTSTTTTQTMVSRPYLSEAWDVWDQRKSRKNPLMNWTIPNLGNEVDVKDNLRFWAHIVASTVI